MSNETMPKPTKELDLSTDEWTQRLAEAPVFAKKGIVQARQVTKQEEVITELADGTKETVNVAEPGDVIVTNPGGEKYVLNPDNFGKRYEATEEEGVFRAKGMARAVQNPTGAPIQIMAPWGEPQFGDENAMVATVFDPEQPDVVGSDRYIIGYQEFLDTYGPANEVLGNSAEQTAK